MIERIQQACNALADHLMGVSGVGPVYADKKKTVLEIRVESHVGTTVTDCLPSSWEGFPTVVTVKPSRVLNSMDRDYRDRWN